MRRAALLLLAGMLAAIPARAEEGPAGFPVFRLDAGDVLQASAQGDGEQAVLHVTLTSAKRREFAGFTGSHVGKEVQIVICGQLRCTPVVKKRIDQLVLDIAYPSRGEADAAAKELSPKAGAPTAPLPAPVPSA